MNTKCMCSCLLPCMHMSLVMSTQCIFWLISTQPEKVVSDDSVQVLKHVLDNVLDYSMWYRGAS